MNILCDGERLSRLTADLSALCGVRIAVVKRDGGGELCASGPRPLFCERVQACPEGRARCRNCETRLEAGGARRCPAGARGAAQPVYSGMRASPVALLCARPFLEATPPRSRQWEALSPALDWYTGDPAALREAFFALPTLPSPADAALAGALEALADYIRLAGLIQPAGETDLQRLERFLDEHYTEKLTLASISAQLHIGRTRLCALAKELSGGETLFSAIARRRIAAAKAMLIRGDRPISAIAEAVGISDYNYFSKIFRAAVGMSPSEFRKRARFDLDNLV